MAFDANRDIRIAAAEEASGRFTLRTSGLADRKRPELVIVGVPEVGLKAAAGVINLVAAHTVNQAEVLAGQSVGIGLAVGDDDRELLVAVRAVVLEKPKGGLWSMLGGAGKGVLRLVDVDASDGEVWPPRTALATMLVHRAAARVANDDEEGARAELEAAIEVFPGEPAGPAPSIAGVRGQLNWQNHLAYLALAELSGRAGDPEQAAAFFGAALARSEELARRELGATLAALSSSEAIVTREAQRIIDDNLAAGPGVTDAKDALAVLRSPIWELADDGASMMRRASRLPSSLVALYYEGVAADELRRAGPALVAKILAGCPGEPWRAGWLARHTRNTWIGEIAPHRDVIGPVHPVAGLVSSILADVARAFYAGATDEEILAHYCRIDDETARQTFDEKICRLEAWESEQYATAMSEDASA